MIEVARPAPTVERLSPPRDRDRLDQYLSIFLAELRRRHVRNAHLVPLYEHLSESVLRGGKRIRPRLCLAAYRIIAGIEEPPPRAVWMCSASLEVFHAFMLVHDDLIDGSVTRRDHATLHEAMRAGHDCPGSSRARKLAADLAMIGGDLLCAMGMRMMSRAGIDPKVLPRVHRVLADMLFETGLGEALDVLFDDCPLGQISESQIIEAYLSKTARYSLSGPLVLGATLATASRPVRRALDRFGDLLGLGYQIRNDLDALSVGPDEGDHPDLDGGKRTFVLWMAYQLMPARGRMAIETALAAPPGPTRRRRLHDLIVHSGALGACEHRLRQLQEQAHRVIVDAPLDSDQQRAILTLIDLLPGGRSCPAATASAHGHA